MSLLLYKISLVFYTENQIIARNLACKTCGITLPYTNARRHNLFEVEVTGIDVSERASASKSVSNTVCEDKHAVCESMGARVVEFAPVTAIDACITCASPTFATSSQTSKGLRSLLAKTKVKFSSSDDQQNPDDPMKKTGVKQIAVDQTVDDVLDRAAHCIKSGAVSSLNNITSSTFSSSSNLPGALLSDAVMGLFCKVKKKGLSEGSTTMITDENDKQSRINVDSRTSDSSSATVAAMNLPRIKVPLATSTSSPPKFDSKWHSSEMKLKINPFNFSLIVKKENSGLVAELAETQPIDFTAAKVTQSM